MSPLSNVNITPSRSPGDPKSEESTSAAFNDLPRKLGSFDAALIIIGIVIGLGIFLLPNLIARELPSTGAIIAVWIVAGLLSYLGALAYAELGAMMPATGGHYVYLREAYGPLCAFVCGWTFMLVVLSGGIAWLGVSFSLYVGQFFHVSPLVSKLIPLVLIAVLSAVNCLGVKESVWVQRIFTSLKIAGILLLIGAGLLSRASVAPAASGVHPLLFNQFGLAMIACLMAYNGWTYISFVAGEIKQPERNIPRALTLSMFMVIGLYVFANIAYMRVLPLSEIAATERVGAAAGRQDDGIGGRGDLVCHRAAVDYWRDQRLHYDGCSCPVRPGARRLFFPAIRSNSSEIPNTSLRNSCPSGVGCCFSADRIVRDALLVFYGGCLDLLYFERRSGVPAPAQSAGPVQAISDVGLSIHAVAVRSGVGLVYRECLCYAACALADGPCHHLDRSSGLSPVSAFAVKLGSVPRLM